ncbi:MAG: hypothetical protein DMD81_23120 [Candidatus Rokuibacteriota bacterium]|nr:MAG: hypothetical protein DMD81_23120 [Candidatus Rokubacteria bacterium]
MYLDFYGLAERPFSTAPDPRFLCLTRRHREALAQLTYGVQEDHGFIVLTGPVGTGKTTLLHALRNLVGPNVAVAFVSSSMLPFKGLLEYILKELGIGAAPRSHAQRLIALDDFLVDRHRAALKTVLILDEAQNFSPETLEQVRLLSNFNHQGARLLQIVLAGQPELATTLALPALRQLGQRVAFRYGIEPLLPGETREYIQRRLRIAGARDDRIFSDRAVSTIARYSGGVPRVINLLCDHCLLVGYAEQRRRIEPDIVEEARKQLHTGSRRHRVLDVARESSTTFRRWAVGTLAAVAIVAGVGMLLTSDPGHFIELARSARHLFMR